MKITRLLCAGVVCAALLPVCGCIHSETPVAISKSTYSTIQESEQQMLSPELKFLTFSFRDITKISINGDLNNRSR